MNRTLEISQIGPGFMDHILRKQYTNMDDMGIVSIEMIKETDDGAVVYLYKMKETYFDWISDLLPRWVIRRLLDIKNTTIIRGDVVEFSIETADSAIHFRTIGKIEIVNPNLIEIAIETPTIRYGFFTLPRFIQQLARGDKAMLKLLRSIEVEVRSCIALSIE